jgi:F-type H+/Na+-transporting ATPase subunit alpha
MSEPKTKTPNDPWLTEQVEATLDAKTGLAGELGGWMRGLRGAVASAKQKPGRARHVGRIVQVADGVATIVGLPEARFNELLRFPGDVLGLVFNLDPDRIGCVLLGDETELSAGDPVYQTDEVIAVPVGEALLGRVVDALGRPLDGEGAIAAERRDPVEKDAAPILDRAPVVEQLITGLKAVDALVPLGRGQRELIVGDRSTGKTAIAVDAMLSQRDNDVICIYAAIGQKTSTVKRVVESLHDHGILRKTIILSADADDAPGLQYVAPYAATTMGEYFMETGRDVLLVYDDLTRHSRAYRELSLLLRRPPGREAYPGDVFFIHSRLLERATHLKPELGGGSLTALPIIETQAKNVSAYIPTNLISITDGQILLDPDLFHKGVKPAMDAGRSVSRVGGKTQLPAIRALAKELRLSYAQFAELEIFTRFGATVEDATKKKIEHGQRIREVLKQQRLDPLTAGEQVLILLAVDRGIIDRLALDKIPAFERALRERLPGQHEALMTKVAAGGKLEDAEWDELTRSVEAVADEFAEPDPEAAEEPEQSEKSDESDRSDQSDAEEKPDETVPAKPDADDAPERSAEPDKPDQSDAEEKPDETVPAEPQPDAGEPPTEEEPTPEGPAEEKA